MSAPIVPNKPPLPGLTPPADAPEDGEAKVVKLPAELLVVRQAVKLSGQVIASSGDGQVRIRTERGDIEIRIPRGQTPPPEKTMVDVIIPAGRPPQNVEVKPATPSDTNTLPPRTTETPVSVDVRPPPRATGETQVHDPAVPVKTLPAQELVQVKPVESREAFFYPPEEIINQSINTTLARTELKAQLAVADVIDKLAAQVIQTQPQRTETTTPTSNIYEPAAKQSVAQTQPRIITVSADIIRKISFPLTTPLTAPQLNLDAQQSIQLTLPVKAAPKTPLSTAQTFLPDIASISKGFETLPISKPEIIFFTKPLEVIAQKVSDIVRAQFSINTASAELKTKPENIGQVLKAPENPLILQNTSATSLPAVVVGQTAEKFPIISMFMPALGTEKLFALQIPVENITIGTQISITPQIPPGVQIPGQGMVAQIALPPPMPLSFMNPEPWPLLQEIQHAMMQVLPPAAQAMSNILPSPANPASFGAAALFFIAAVRGGDISQWLGERGIETIRRAGRGDLLSRLGQEGNALGRLASETVSQDWRGMSVPLMWQNEIQKMALYYKQDSSGEEGRDERGKQTRFIFDLKLDQMGSVQLDGLFRTKRLDLILRTKESLSQPMQMQMRRAYTNALEVAGVNGEISFQNRPEQWVTITPDNKKLMGAA